MKKSHLLTAAAGAIAIMASPAYALSAGDAQVLSNADQPMRAMIPIKADDSEWPSLVASAQTTEPSLGLSAILYKPSTPSSDGFMEIRSIHPVAQAVVDVQVTLRVGGKQVVQRLPILMNLTPSPIASAETTLLVEAPAVAQDPELVMFPQRGPFPDVKAVVQPLDTHIRASTYTTPPDFNQASARASLDLNVPSGSKKSAASGLSLKAGDAQYTVKKGDGLYTIALKNKPALLSAEEAMAQLFKHNRAAFGGTSYNTLKAGSVLDVSFSDFPSRAQTSASNAEPSKAQSAFTKADAEAAVARHRISKLEKEFKSLLPKNAS